MKHSPSHTLIAKIWITLFIIFLNFNQHISKADDCAQREWYSRYLCQVENTCDPYDLYTGGKSFNTEQTERMYQEWYNLYIAKNLYRENMNSIYKCAILKSQNDAFSKIITTLNNSNSYLSADFTTRIKDQQERLQKQINNLECERASPQKTNFNSKQQVLSEATLEMYKYLHFLDYVDNTHIDDIWNVIKDKEISEQVEAVFEQNPEAWIEAYLDLWNVEDYEFEEEKYTVQNILGLQLEANREIEEEIEHTKRVYQVAFQTYANYESNMVIHLLFGMLESDFRKVRDTIYAMLGPINQVAYKIPNATSY